MVRTAFKIAGAIVAVPVLLLLVLRLAAMVRERGAEPPPGMAMVATPLGRVAADIRGPADGPPVLLVHGSAAWSGFWRDVTAHLAARGYRVIAVDQPPFGWSDRDPQGRYDRVSQAARLAAVIGHRPAIVVGHSFGAGSAAELSLRHPGKVRALVLVDAALGQLDRTSDGAGARVMRVGPVAELVTAATISNPSMMGPLLRRFIHRKGAAGPWLATLAAPMRRSGSTAAYARWLPHLLEADDGALSRTRAGLAAIRVPVAVIWGQADTITPPAQGREIARLTRARSLEWLPGTGHIPHIENPALFLPALDRAVTAAAKER